MALGACSIDSTGLRSPDTSVRIDVPEPDAGADVDGPDVMMDAGTPDVPVVRDVGLDVPMDVMLDVPPDMGTPDVPVVPDVCSDPGVVACYLFENDAMDSSSEGNHLTDVNLGFMPDGIAGSAGAFSDLTELSLRSRPLGLGVQFTVELWFQMKEAIPTGDARQALLDNNGGLGLFLYRLGGDDSVRLAAEFVDRSASRNVDVEGWHHLVAVSDTGGVALFVDDAQQSRPGAASSDTSVDLHVGSNATADNDVFEQNFIGNIDQIRIWDRALSDTEVEALLSAD